MPCFGRPIKVLPEGQKDERSSDQILDDYLANQRGLPDETGKDRGRAEDPGRTRRAAGAAMKRRIGPTISVYYLTE